MELKNEYLKSVIEKVAKRNANEPEFLQTVTEVLTALSLLSSRDLTL